MSFDPFVDTLERKLKEHEQRKKEATKLIEEESKLTNLTRDAQKKEQEVLGRKLSFAERVLIWAREFSQTDTYKRLLETINLRISGHDEIYVNGGGWAHELPCNHSVYNCYSEYDKSCDWSRLYLKQDSTLHYWAGYRQHPGTADFIIKTPEELTQKLCSAYIAKLAGKVETCTVYKTIRKWHLEK